MEPISKSPTKRKRKYHARKGPGWNNPTRVPIRNKHPLVQQLFSEIVKQGLTYHGLEKVTGYGVGTISAWAQGRNGMRLVSFIDIANFLGYDVKLVPMAGREEKKK